MGTMKHTPRPWAFSEESGEVYYADKDVQPLIAIVSCENCQTHKQYLADGKLIAAAPELLAALQSAYELIDNSDVRYFISNNLGEQAQLHSALHKARAAIASATTSTEGK